MNLNLFYLRKYILILNLFHLKNQVFMIFKNHKFNNKKLLFYKIIYKFIKKNINLF